MRAPKTFNINKNDRDEKGSKRRNKGRNYACLGRRSKGIHKKKSFDGEIDYGLFLYLMIIVVV